MTRLAAPLWQNPAVQQAVGDTLRPGGFALTDRACELAGLKPGQAVLDVGCGRGATVQRLRSRYGARAVGLDLEPRPLPGRPPLVRGRAERLPFANKSFSLALCECVLSLVEDPGRALAEFYRVLGPGGVLALSDLYRPRRQNQSRDTCSCASGALTRTELLERLSKAWFHVICFEDHSGLLRDLAAQLAWQGVSPGACGAGTGYCLVLARVRPETAHG